MRHNCSQITLILLCITFLSPVYSIAQTIPISTTTNDQYRPGLVYNNSDQEYLVIWEHEFSSTDHDIRARRITVDGAPVAGEFDVAWTGNNESKPAIAYNSIGHEYLAVWEYEFNATDHDIYAQRLAADGTLLGAVIAIATSGINESSPDVIYNTSAGEFLIVWEYLSGSGEFIHNDIYGIRVSTAGIVQGSTMIIASGLVDESSPDVACTSSGDYLVVWQDIQDATGDYGIYGQRLYSSGALLGGQIAIVSWNEDQIKPSVAYNSNAGEYLVVWEDHYWQASDGWDIFGRRINSSGIAIGGYLQISWQGTNKRENPHITYQSFLDEYLVTWEYEFSPSDHDIYYRRVQTDGSLPTAEMVISNGGQHERRPALAADDGISHLIVWDDARDVATQGLDIYGLWYTVPLASGFVFEGDLGDESTPLPGVTVELYGSNDSGTIGTLLDSTITDFQGRFSFPLEGAWEYFNIISYDLTNYSSVGAATFGGTVINNNQIQYAAPLTGKELTENKFWDLPDPLQITFGPAQDLLTQNTVQISWNTNYPSDSLVKFGSSAVFDQEQFNPTLVTSHNLDLTGLIPSTTYQYQVESVDAVGEKVISPILNFETLPVPDIQEPNISIPILETGVNLMTLSANAQDNIGLKKVEFYVDDALIYTDYSSDYSYQLDTTQYANGPHSLKVIAYDLIGLIKQDTRTFGVANLIDATAPTVDITSPSQNDTVSGKITVSSLLTDDTGFLSGTLRVDGEWFGNWYPDDHAKTNLTAQMDLDTTQLTNGGYRIAFEVYDNDFKYAFDTVDVTVNNSPPALPPKLIVKRNVTRHGNYFAVALTVSNVGGERAMDIRMQENLQLFQPVSRIGALADYEATFNPDLTSWQMDITCHVDIYPGQAQTFTYYAVPVLVYPSSLMPKIGGDKYSDLISLWYDQPGSPNLIYDRIKLVFIPAASYQSALKASDYLIVTSPGNLLKINSKDDVNKLLSASAELAQLKNGVLGFLDVPAAFNRDYQQYDGFAVGDVIGGNPDDDIVVADMDQDEIYIYQVQKGSFYFGDPVKNTFDLTWRFQRHFPCGYNQQGFDSGDKIAIGDLPGGTRDKIVMTDHSADFFYIYDDQGTVQSSFYRNDIEAHDGLAVGDVLGQGAAQIVFADRSADRIYLYHSSGLKLSDFPQNFEAHDGLAVGDVASGKAEEIVFADLSTNTIFVLDAAGNVTRSFPYTFDTGDTLTVGNVIRTWPDDKEEIIIADHSADRISIYRYDGYKYRSFSSILDSHNGFAAGSVTGLNRGEILITDYNENSIDIHNADTANDKHVLHNLIKQGGLWANKLHNDWDSDGYLLIVGETEIIPAYGDRTFGSAYTTRGDITLKTDVTDLPYANTTGSEMYPELSLGRIIGNSARDLTIPIQNSINVATATPTFTFDRNPCLLVSGFPRGLGGGADNINFKAEVNDVSKAIAKTNPNATRTLLNTPDFKQHNDDATKLVVNSIFFSSVDNRDVIFLSGHGNSSSWDTIDRSDVIMKQDPFAWSNPFIFASSCTTGRYVDGLSIADAFIKRGAAVYLGATIFGLGAHAGVSKKFFEKWDIGESVGLAVKQTKRSLGGSSSDKYWKGIYHVFGDPKYGTQGPPSPAPMSAQDDPLTQDDDLSLIQLTVPDYEITFFEANEYVDIPGGDLLVVQDKPLVPYYRAFYDYSTGFQIQNVTLSARSDPNISFGHNFPIADIGHGSSYPALLPAPPDEIPQWWPELEAQFDWHVIENPDGSTLALTVYPFYYNAMTTEVRFHKYYDFNINFTISDLSITQLETDKFTYDLNEPVSVDLEINNTGPARDVIVSTEIKEEGSEQIITGLLLQTLDNFTGSASYRLTWDTTGALPGSYRIEVTIKDNQGIILDKKIENLNLGIAAGQITHFAIDPNFYKAGDNIGMDLSFKNTGSININGEAVLRIYDAADELIDQFNHPITDLLPEDTVNFHDTWTTSAVGPCTVVAHVTFGGQAVGSEILALTECSGFLFSADLSRDCYINLIDYAYFASHWLNADCGDAIGCFGADLNLDGTVNLKDLYLIVTQWLWCNYPADAYCDVYWK